MRVTRTNKAALGLKRHTLAVDKADGLFTLLQLHGVFPMPLREYKFLEQRKFRFDLAWPSRKIAVEVDGGVWTGGRHTRGKGFEADCEKMTEAAILGWRVLRVTPRHVKSGQAVEWIRRRWGCDMENLTIESLARALHETKFDANHATGFHCEEFETDDEGIFVTVMRDFDSLPDDIKANARTQARLLFERIMR